MPPPDVPWRNWFEALAKLGAATHSVSGLDKSAVKLDQLEVDLAKRLGEKAAEDASIDLLLLYADKLKQLAELGNAHPIAKFFKGHAHLVKEVELLDQLKEKAQRHAKKLPEESLRALKRQRADALQSAFKDRYERAHQLNEELKTAPERAILEIPKSSALPSSDIKQADVYLNAVKHWVKQQLPILNAHQKAYEHVQPSVMAVVEFLPQTCRLGKVAANSMIALQHSLNSGPKLQLDEMLKKGSEPCGMRTQAGYVSFWTAVAAGLRFQKTGVKDRSSEATRTAEWLADWSAASEAWPQDCLTAFGYGPGELCSATMRMDTTKGETLSGGDAILLIWAKKADGTSTCFALNLQFKPARGGNATLNVERMGWRQFTAMADLQVKTSEKFKSWYALQRDGQEGLASVCAISINEAAAALGQNIQDVDDTIKKFSFEWRDRSQSLPTAILRSVTDAHPQPYARPYEALQDMLSLTGHDFTGYVLVQAFGHDRAQLELEIEACSELAQDFQVLPNPQYRNGLAVDREDAREDVKPPRP